MAETAESLHSELGASILVVDQDAGELAGLSTLLRLIGYHVQEATTAETALGLLQSTPCHLLLLDPHLPGMDGGDLMLRAREVRPHLPIIVLTARPSIESAIAAVKAGAADYLLEPFRIEDLCSSISQALRDQAEESSRQQLLDLIRGTLRTLGQADTPGDSVAPQSSTTAGRFVQAGALTLDRQKRMAVVNSTPHRSAELTEGEAAVLAALMNQTDQVLSCKQLARVAMGYELYEKQAQSVVRPYIFRLRRKIESSPDNPCLIRTVRGRGYFLSVAGAA